MKNAVFCDIKTQIEHLRRHIDSQLQSPAGKFYVRVVVFKAVTMKNSVFRDIKAQFLPHKRHMSLLQSPVG
jgi:hypothetical protein